MNATTLKLEIVRRGLHQVDVAMQAGIHPSRFCLACNGRIGLNRDEMLRVAEILNMSTEELFPEKRLPASRAFNRVLPVPA